MAPVTIGEDYLQQALDWHRSGRSVAIAMVVDTWGSSPRPIGSLMVIDGEQNFGGSVSGGCVEAAVIEAAREAIKLKRIRLLGFDIGNDDAWAFGLACGGKMRALIVPLTAQMAMDLDKALTRRRTGKSSALLFPLCDNNSPQISIFLDCRDPSEKPPTSTDTQIQQAINSDRSLIIVPPKSSPKLPTKLPTKLESDSHKLAVPESFALIVSPPPRLIIIGAVHIAQELVPLAVKAGFETIVIDPRQGFATTERFPNIRLIHDWPDRALHELRLDHRTAIVTMTHETRLDDAALTAAFAAPVFYIGALGSKKTQAARLVRMQERGIDSEQFTRLHGPVGLNIGAATAPEIAISIIAEIIATRRGSSVIKRE